jgi:uncharacterized membrane protein
MNIDITTNIAAPAALVWATIADVERWPEWTASVTSVKRLDEGPLRVGSRAEIKQPGFPRVVWTVTEIVEGTTFSWEARSPGIHSVGLHTVTGNADHASIRLSINQTGPLAGVMRLLFGKRSTRYVQMEGAGIKARCEAATRAAATDRV